MTFSGKQIYLKSIIWSEKTQTQNKKTYIALHIWILVQNLGREDDIRWGGKMKYSHERDYKANFCIFSSYYSLNVFWSYSFLSLRSSQILPTSLPIQLHDLYQKNQNKQTKSIKQNYQNKTKNTQSTWSLFWSLFYISQLLLAWGLFWSDIPLKKTEFFLCLQVSTAVRFLVRGKTLCLASLFHAFVWF